MPHAKYSATIKEFEEMKDLDCVCQETQITWGMEEHMKSWVKSYKNDLQCFRNI